MHPTIRKVCRIVFWLEIIVNVINGVIAMADPILALQGMTNVDLSDASTAVGLETYRWFGALSLVFGGYIFYRLLDSPGLKPVLEGLLIGDVLYLGSLTPFTYRYGKLPMILGPYVLTLIMFIARIVYLLQEDWKSVGTNNDPTGNGSTPNSNPDATLQAKLLVSPSSVDEEVSPKGLSNKRSTSTVGRESKRRTSTK